jgi:hypothetical protein
VWVRPRHALLAFGAHRSPLAVLASDHLPVKAIIATHELPQRAAATRAEDRRLRVMGRSPDTL